MLKKLFFLTLLSSAVIFVLNSCKNDVVYNNFVKIPDKTWAYDSLVTFTVKIDDTSSKYNIFLSVSHTSSYPYRNLWIKVITKAPNNATEIDTLNLPLQDEQSFWLGKKYGKKYKTVFIFKDTVMFPLKGNYKFFVQHIMRPQQITDISEIGLKIKKIKIQNE